MLFRSVASTSSPHNFDLVKTYGADIVLDYNDPNCASEIRNRTDGNVYYAFDTPADAESARICAEVLSTDATARQPVYNALLAGLGKFPRQDVKNTFTFAYTVFGEEYHGGDIHHDADEEDFAFGTRFARIVEDLLEKGKVKTHPVDVRTGGWERVLEGVDELRQKKVSGKKLVYKIS